MGLDCYWKVPPYLEWPEFDPPLKLCDGLFSGSGQGSFRGKVYSGFIETVSGISLYEELDNEAVKQIATDLEETTFLPETAEAYGIELNEFEDLKRMFRKYADAGAELVPWY